MALISPATDSNLILIPNSVFLYFLLTSVFQRCWFIWDGRRVTLRPTTSHGFLAAVKIAFAPALSRAAQIDVQRVPAVVVALAAGVPAQAEAAACTYCVLSAVAGPT